MERKVSPRLSLRAEYRHTDFDSEQIRAVSESTFTNDEDTSNFRITATGKFEADIDTVNFAVVYSLQ